MEKGNRQKRQPQEEGAECASHYQPKSRQDVQGYGARSFDNRKESESYIDQDSLRRRESASDDGGVWRSRIDGSRITGTTYVQGHRGDWSQFESADSEYSSQHPRRLRSNFSRDRSYYSSNRDNDYPQEARETNATTFPPRADRHSSRRSVYGSTRPSDQGGPYTGRGPKGYRRSDERIVEEACLSLERAGDVDAREVEVTCSHGVITLRGKVEDRSSKRRAEECVEDVYGVRDVMNELQVAEGLLTRVFDSGDGTTARDELIGKL